MCPVNYWCHVGSTQQTTLCCPGGLFYYNKLIIISYIRICILISATIPCSVPFTPGTGTSRLQRWYYNSDTKSCQEFQYFGPGGNQNNFETLSECQKTCPGKFLCDLFVFHQFIK